MPTSTRRARRRIACFTAGTLIRTAGGEREVQTLAPGDVVPTARGGEATVRWLGHRRVRCDRLARPADAHPVLIAAGAFGDGLPMRDLRLSPHHAVLMDGALIPVRLLLNGRGLRQEAVDSVEYWHVELDRHDVILAEGLPAESWLDRGDRDLFANADCVRLGFDEARAAPRRSRLACARMVTGGPALKAARRRLDGFITVELDQDGMHELAIPASCEGVRLLTPGGVLGGAWLDGAPLDGSLFRAGFVVPDHFDLLHLAEEAFIGLPPARRTRALRLELVLERRREA